MRRTPRGVVAVDFNPTAHNTRWGRSGAPDIEGRSGAVGSDPTVTTSTRWEDLAAMVVEEVVAVGS